MDRLQVLRYSDSVDMDSRPIKDVIEDLQKLLGRYGNNALTLDDGDAYLIYYTPETDEEYNKRIEKENTQRDRELKILATLKAKYESTST